LQKKNNYAIRVTCGRMQTVNDVT